MSSDDDSFNLSVQRVKSIISSAKASCSKEKNGNREENPDSDDSFDNFEPTQRSVNRTNQVEQQLTENKPKITNPKPMPLWWQESQRNSQKTTMQTIKPILPMATTMRKEKKAEKVENNNSFTRHGSDNSFFKGQNSSQIIQSISKLAPSSTSGTSRPSTPSGEELMLRNKVEIEKKEKQKLAAYYQKLINDMTENHKKQLDQKKEECTKLEKENEILKTTSACRRIEMEAQDAVRKVDNESSPSRFNVKKVMVKIPRSSNTRPRFSVGNGLKTPISKPVMTPRRNHRIMTPLSAFQHDNRLKLPNRNKMELEEEETFQLEESFQPQVTSTPITVHSARHNGLRRVLNLLDDQETIGEPAPKKTKKHVEKPQRSRREIREITQRKFEEIQKREKPNESDSDSDAVSDENEKKTENEDIDDEKKWLYEIQNTRIKRGKKKEKNDKMTKSKIKAILNKADQVEKQIPKCSKCKIEEIQESHPVEKKEWEEMEAQKIEKDQKLAESQMMLMFSTLLQNINRKGIEEIEKSETTVDEAEKRVKEKCEMIERRTLENIREEALESWRTKYMEELREKGELNAELESEGCSMKQKDDYIWTSESDDDNFEYPASANFNKWELCEFCSKWQRNEKRIWKREQKKTKLKLECYNEAEKERREQIRNMSVLTKSKIEAADEELNQQMDEIIGGRLLDDEEDEEEEENKDEEDKEKEEDEIFWQ